MLVRLGDVRCPASKTLQHAFTVCDRGDSRPEDAQGAADIKGSVDNVAGGPARFDRVKKHFDAFIAASRPSIA